MISKIFKHLQLFFIFIVIGIEFKQNVIMNILKKILPLIFLFSIAFFSCEQENSQPQKSNSKTNNNNSTEYYSDTLYFMADSTESENSHKISQEAATLSIYFYNKKIDSNNIINQNRKINDYKLEKDIQNLNIKKQNKCDTDKNKKENIIFYNQNKIIYGWILINESDNVEKKQFILFKLNLKTDNFDIYYNNYNNDDANLIEEENCDYYDDINLFKINL